MYVLAVCVCEEEFIYIEKDVYRWVSYVLCECLCLSVEVHIYCVYRMCGYLSSFRLFY